MRFIILAILATSFLTACTDMGMGGNNGIVPDTGYGSAEAKTAHHGGPGSYGDGTDTGSEVPFTDSQLHPLAPDASSQAQTSANSSLRGIANY